jgi:site-specific DNA-methyltransferase (adenine-specific)
MKQEIHNEDCLITMSRLGNESVDLLLQDPPYGTTRNIWDAKPNLKQMWREWLRIIKPNGAMIFTAAQPFASELIVSQPQLFRYDLIWHKPNGTGFLNAKKMPLRNHEHILVFYKKLPTYNPIMGKGKNKKGVRRKTTNGDNYGAFTGEAGKRYDDKGKRYPNSIITISNGNRNHNENYHPTQKPVDLMRYLIKTYSNEGDLVFDGYSGSGTTAIACAIENRNFVGSETDRTYHRKSIERLKRFKAQPTIF